jgi:hypothetical protein
VLLTLPLPTPAIGPNRAYSRFNHAYSSALTSWRRARQCAKRTEPDDVSVNNSARSTSQLGTQHITEPIERIRLTVGSFA